MAFVGNTDRSVGYMVRHSDLFEALPKGYYDTAFLDRLHCYLPGWEVDIIRNEMFTDGYGFIVDYYAECLRHLRRSDYANILQDRIKLDASISTRDKDGIRKTVSGLAKLIYPHRELTDAELNELVRFGIEGRRRVKDQLLRMDATYADVNFSYTDLASGTTTEVITREVRDHPPLPEDPSPINTVSSESTDGETESADSPPAPTEPQEGHRVISSDDRGVSYELLFADHLRGAREVHLFDGYLHNRRQIQLLHEFCELLLNLTEPGEEVILKVYTGKDRRDPYQQEKLFDQLESTYATTELRLIVEREDQPAHDRSIQTDTGWKIILGRGLDIFQPYDYKNPFNLARTDQRRRRTRDVEVTYVRIGVE